MASTSTAKKFKSDYSESVCGYIHNVSALKTSLRTGYKFFNAEFQVNRDECHDVVVFAVEKRTAFVQANRNQSPVKLDRIARRVSKNGSEYDIHCGTCTAISVVADLGYPFKSPSLKLKTIAEVKTMAPKQNVAAVQVKAVHVGSGSETASINGVPVDMQTCYVADHTSRMKLSLWETQVGALVHNKLYEITNVCTREFEGEFYLTATRFTQFKEVAALSAPAINTPFTVEEGEITVVTGEISGVEVSIRRCCIKCRAWQADFNSKAKFHRCVKCGLLQKILNFLPTVTAKVSVSGDFGEDEFKLCNSVLRHHLEEEGLCNLLLDAQNVEEYLLEMGVCAFKLQKSVVIALSKVELDKVEAEAEPEVLVGEAASLLEGEMESLFEEFAESEVLVAETVLAEANSLLDQQVESSETSLPSESVKH
ncbi:hypothetical protein R3I93_021013 [Phoxinus phoxinus]|uniref:Uncharacterized protein n=1 Tax=Phoxinus phoxinus TaxID=58324 RepID=A0AAN9C7M3_9TELE